MDKHTARRLIYAQLSRLLNDSPETFLELAENNTDRKRLKKMLFTVRDECERKAGEDAMILLPKKDHWIFKTPDMRVDTPSVKKCSKCGEVKPLKDFHQQSQGYLGRRADCKKCRISINRQCRKRKAQVE